MIRITLLAEIGMKVLKSVELSNREAAWYLRIGRSRTIEYGYLRSLVWRQTIDVNGKHQTDGEELAVYIYRLRRAIQDLYLDSPTSFECPETRLWFNGFFRVMEKLFLLLTRVVRMCVKTVRPKFVFKRQLKQRVIITETRERARTKGFDTSKRSDRFRPRARTVTARFPRRTPKST